jgi:trafficking protein particle complex subunit 5
MSPPRSWPPAPNDDSYLFPLFNLSTLDNSTYVSVPPDFGGLSVDSYLSGILAGLLEGAGFPARVTAHAVALEDGEDNNTNAGGSNLGSGGHHHHHTIFNDRNEKTVFLVKFAASVLERDAQMS